MPREILHKLAEINDDDAAAAAAASAHNIQSFSSIQSSYDAFDDARIRPPSMSTFRCASPNTSISMEPSTDFDIFQGHTPQMSLESSSITPSTSAGLPGVVETVLVERRRPKAGILRLDINKPRRSSGGSVEFRSEPQWLGEPNSPIRVTSPHQLSVTWAETCGTNESHLKFKPMQECAEDAELSSNLNDRINGSEERQTYELSSPVKLGNCELPLQNYPSDDYISNINNNWNSSNSNEEKDNDDEDDEEDYSVSVSAIMQRRASIRGYRNKRGSRCSRQFSTSPMDHILDSMDTRRRSSVYTSSSDEGTNQESTQEQIFENIRLHKEVIQSVKLQPWPIRKKLKLVRQAKTYVARHEGALQERFAMSRSTKDLFARFKILMAARWRHWKRETSSFLTVLIPWELRIKEIESHFGSGVASYFTFLRWLMWVNIMIAIPLVAFVIGPEYFATKHDETDPRKRMSDHEFKVAGNLFTIWEFEGYLKYSPMFYGYYSSVSGASSLGYKLPLAYFLTAVLVYIYSFVATLRKMAENSRNSKLSSKDDECTFSWKLFTGWDFMIGHAETAHNRIASVVVGFKEALLEEAEKKKDKRNWRIILQRIMVNILVMGLLAASGYTVVLLVNKSEELARQDNWLSRNAVNVTMTLISFFLPMIFEALGLFENWHPRQQLRLQLARIMILNMLNLYSLMFSFIYKINSKERPLQDLKIKNETATSDLERLTMLIQSLSTTLSYETPGLISTSTTSMPFGMSSTITSANANGISGSNSSYNNSDENWSTKTTTEMVLTTTATTLFTATLNRLKCYNITVQCSKPNRITRMSTLATTLLFMNLTTTMLPPTTEPMSTTFNATADYMMTTPSGLTTLDTTINFDTTMFGKFSKENYTSSLGITQTDDISTTTQSSTAKTPPIEASFFDFYDYFAGFPIEIDKDIMVGNQPNDGETTSTPNKRISHPTTQATHYDSQQQQQQQRKTQNLKRLKRQNHKGATAIRSPSLTSILSNTKNEKNVHQSPSDRISNPVYPYASTQYYRPNQRTFDSSPSSALPFTRAPRSSDTATATATTTGAFSDSSQVTGNSGIGNDFGTNDRGNFDTNTDSNGNDITTSQSELWVPNADLQEVLAYFTNSSTTTAMPAHKMTSTTTMDTTTSIHTTDATAERASTTLSADSSTPYFIDDDKIEGVGEPSYYDMHDINDGLFENCIRTICEEILPTEVSTSRTTEFDSTTDTALLQSLTPLERNQVQLIQVKALLSEVQKNLTNMCWETSLGQELSKVIVFDGLMGIVAPLCIDFLRALFVRYVNRNWCWDMEKTFPQYGDFKIAENILTLIYNQGQVWMGIFFSPGLVLINLVKLVIMMYFRSWIVLTCNVPHEVVFKASKSNNFYLTLLLTMLFLCVLPVGYAIVWLRPSWHCGPFSDYNRIAEFITNTTRNALPKELHEPLDYLTSASTVIPLLLLLVLIIYYLVSLTGALREANQDLRTQLQKEREEERRKMFKVPELKPIEPPAATLTSRWRKVLEASSPVTPTQPPDFETEEYKNQARKELISRIMKKALRKGSATSDEESVVRQGRDDDDTDTEHHDSLPHDEEGKDRIFGISKLQQIRRTRKPSLVDIVQIAKSERERERKASMAAAAAAAAAGGAPDTTPTAIDQSHQKSRFKLHERKDRMENSKDNNEEKRHPTPSENEHDPDVNSRIVNERRESLLRRKREEDERKRKQTLDQLTKGTINKGLGVKTISCAELDKPTTDQLEIDTGIPKRREHSSSFRVINEKRAMQEPESAVTFSDKPKPKPPPRKERNPFRESVKFKFITQRLRSPAGPSHEPEVFKFEDKPKKHGRTFEIPNISFPGHSGHSRTETHGSKSNGESVTPPHTPSPLKYTNSEKLASLSRQGRKKIGSFLQLMREAAKKFEMEQLQQQQQQHPGQEREPRVASEPTSPLPTAVAPPTPIPAPKLSTTNASDAISTTTDIPKEIPTTESTDAIPVTVVTSTTKTIEAKLSSKFAKPQPISKIDPEERDQARPITFPQRSVSLSRRTSNEHPVATRQESQASNWSDNIPTITISTTGSDEFVAEPDSSPTSSPSHYETPPQGVVTAPPSPTAQPTHPPETTAETTSAKSQSESPKVNIIKFTIENEK